MYDFGKYVPTMMSALVAAALFAGPAHAQSGASWLCDAENGRFSENPQSLGGGPHVLSGRVQFQAGHTEGRWDPVAKIGFDNSATSSNCDCAGLLATIYPSRPDIVTLFVIANGQKVGVAQAPLGRAITFRLSLDGAGVFTARVGKTSPQVKTFKLRNPRLTTMHMSCSSAAVNFLEIEGR